MTTEAVAALVERGDPERWRSAMVAPPVARPGLMALYAFNLEIARAPWVAHEPMLAEIRLRWWADAVAESFAGLPPRRHEVAEPLAALIGAGGLPQRLFEEMIDSRAFDADAAMHPDRAALDRYLAHTTGHLMELAARHLGAQGAALPVVRDFAQGAGIAALIRALPALRARGRDPLPADTASAALADDGLKLLARARAQRTKVPRAALPALLAAASAGTRLRHAAAGRDPEISEFRARAELLARAATGRW